jgi:Carboxypeptidase regulatory-like domain
MYRIFAKILILMLVLPAYSISGSAAAASGSIRGSATDDNGRALVGYVVQPRDMITGALVGATKSSSAGSFEFAGLPAGNYVVEAVNERGQVVGTSGPIHLPAGGAVSSVPVHAHILGFLGLGALGPGATAGVVVGLVGGGIALGYGIHRAIASPSR